mmetsp:Transcript_65011/g.102390  ORF Transcript_65011/g.102390 Transcript_65011/m.102390 type:complete len:88 (-) Transcript_65011:226-489(-)
MRKLVRRKAMLTFRSLANRKKTRPRPPLMTQRSKVSRVPPLLLYQMTAKPTDCLMSAIGFQFAPKYKSCMPSSLYPHRKLSQFLMTS